jgi:hypothetical protein
MGAQPHVFLDRAIEAARRALRDLDDDQVPADLRRVAAHSGALPPPLAAALLKGLDRYEWLRERALEAWPDADAEAPGPDAAAAAYLRRDPGWVGAVLGSFSRWAADDLRAETAVRSGALSEAQRRLEDCRRRMRDLRADSERRIRDLERRLEEARKARRSLQAGRAREDAGMEASLVSMRGQLAEQESQLGAAGRSITELREELRRERRLRAEAEAAAAELSARGGLSAGGADELAGRLDELAILARPPTIAPGPAAETAAGFRLPAEVLPDAAEAVEWLVSEAPPVTVLIDGYNAGFLLTGATDPAAARARLELDLSRLVTVASGRLAAVVVYDSAIDRAEKRSRRGGVEALFTAGRSADDVLVELAADLAGRRVVVSNDREVRERAERAGAVALWSAALRAWSQRA